MRFVIDQRISFSIQIVYLSHVCVSFDQHKEDWIKYNHVYLLLAIITFVGCVTFPFSFLSAFSSSFHQVIKVILLRFIANKNIIFYFLKRQTSNLNYFPLLQVHSLPKWILDYQKYIFGWWGNIQVPERGRRSGTRATDLFCLFKSSM
jgi:hypothetical protein